MVPAWRLLAADGEALVVDDVDVDGVGVTEGDGGVDGRKGVSDLDSSLDQNTVWRTRILTWARS